MSASITSTSPGSAGALPAAGHVPNANLALWVGLGGIALTALGLLVPGGGAAQVAISWLVGLTFWTGIALGMLFLVMIHHLFDANWSVVLRRQYEHGLAAFPWLALLFLPLIIASWLHPSLLWKWMDPNFDLSTIGGHGTVREDVLWIKKSGMLNLRFFVALTAVSFGFWTLLASRLRRNSFRQDADGDPRWTRSNRRWSAGGIALTALTLTACIILWVKSLEYHWFSTMYGVWYFSACIRAALAVGVILLVWLWRRGDLQGILNDNHLHSIGQLMLAFTVFWAYITFSQYFLIWNANVPEETFWYNVREINNSNGQPNQWMWVGMFLLFGYFVVPFLLLLWYPLKLKKQWMQWVGAFGAFAYLVDLWYNILPSAKLLNGDPQPFLRSGLIWSLTAIVGIGGVCLWAYLRSFATTKIIPIRDPRIAECLIYHQPYAD
jgi:hypothetical protein